jgi:hypothetical protein
MLTDRQGPLVYKRNFADDLTSMSNRKQFKGEPTMKYEYTDTAQVQVKISFTPWELSKLAKWLTEVEGDDYNREHMITNINDWLGRAQQAMSYESETIKSYIKSENNNA